MTSIPSSQPSSREPGPDLARSPEGDPPVEQDSNAGLYLVAGIFVAGCVLIVLKFLGILT